MHSTRNELPPRNALSLLINVDAFAVTCIGAANSSTWFLQMIRMNTGAKIPFIALHILCYY